MKLTSPAFEHGGNIPAEYTCDGKNINPELHFSGVPKDAEALVLIMDDPDVPDYVRKDKLWVHWIVFDIPPNETQIPQDSQPPGIPGVNTGGELKYDGPCPPDREHRYFFKLYALDAPLNLPRGASKAEVEQAMEKHIIAKTELMGKYDRKR